MADNRYEALKLERQLCFPLYACSKEIVRRYKPFLDPLGLTYTQYIAMMVVWEHSPVSSKEMGRLLYLDSGTLTPVLKRLEEKGLIMRERDARDARNLVVAVTDAGLALRDRAADVPLQLGSCLGISRDDALRLKEILTRLLAEMA